MPAARFTSSTLLTDMQRINSFGELKFQTHDDDRLPWLMISIAGLIRRWGAKDGPPMNREPSESPSIGGRNWRGGGRAMEGDERMPHCNGETWCSWKVAKWQSWASYEPGKSSQRGNQPLVTRSPIGSCGFRFIVPLKLATFTAHSQHKQFPSPALQLVHLQFIFHTKLLLLDFKTWFSLFILYKMAAVTSVVSGSVAAAPLSVTRLSSCATSAAAPAQFAPVRNVNLSGSRVLAVNATYSEVCVDLPRMVASNFWKPLKISRRIQI